MLQPCIRLARSKYGLLKLRGLNANITITETEFDYRIRGDQFKFGRDESAALIYPYIPV